MSFEKSIREDFSDIPVVFFLGGQGTRMEDLAYKHVVLSKQWLPIGFDENNEPIPLFWKNFEILLELGFKEFYIIVNKDGEKVKRYFEKKLSKLNSSINVWLVNKETVVRKQKSAGVNIYIFENDVEGTADQLLALKPVVESRIFLRINGDEHFRGEKVKREIRAFIEYALEKIEKEKAIEVFAFVDKKIAIGSIWGGLGIKGNEQSGKIIKTNESNFIITSICLASPEFFKILQAEKKNSIPLDVASPEIVKKIIESQRVYGKVIDVEVFSNVNTSKDYFKLVSYIKESTQQNKESKFIKVGV
jgi:NDP-sugar pyrophosphorylase family protein